ncbi:MAG: helix-turn-helix domain-containing protein [Planctomycetes bacterium]|nr:helix-turn-helix domain-containing protein [Planctomycetota bacterium]
MARNMEDDIFTPEEAAEALGVKVMTLYQWVHRKKIKCFRIGYGQQRIRFRRREVESLVEKRRAAQAERAKAKKTKKTKKAAKRSTKSKKATRKKVDIDAAVRESLLPKRKS